MGECPMAGSIVWHDGLPGLSIAKKVGGTYQSIMLVRRKPRKLAGCQSVNTAIGNFEEESCGELLHF